MSSRSALTTVAFMTSVAVLALTTPLSASATATCPDARKHTDSVGTVIKTLEDTNPDKLLARCCDECAALPECTAFTHVIAFETENGVMARCLLKSVVKGFVDMASMEDAVFQTVVMLPKHQ